MILIYMDQNNKIQIALDLDDTIADFINTFNDYFNVNLSKMKSDDITNLVITLKHNKLFWSNLPVLEVPDFKPSVYATKRINPKLYTKAFLTKNKLPIRPIIQFYNQSDNKAFGLVGKADVLIDDSWFNVKQCLDAGFPALLITRPHNKRIRTKYRVDHLSYNEIEQKYNELF